MKNIIFISLVFTSNILAQQISFSNALSQTLKNNHELKAKTLEIKKIEEDLLNAKGYELGNLTLSENIVQSNNPLHVFGMKLAAKEATFGDFGFSEFNPALMTTPAGQQQLLSTKPNDLNNPKTRTNFETKLVYQLPLFTGFKLSSAKDMARLQIEAQKAKFQYDEKQLSLEVLKAYNGAVAAKYFIYATQKAKKATLSFVTFAQEMYNEGYITNIDVDQARLYDLKIDSMLIEAKNKYALAIAYLKFLTNDTTITDVEDFQTIKVNNVDVNTLQKNALKYRADLEWMKHNNLTMKKKIDYEKSGNYPMIGAHFEYGLNDNQLNNFNTSKEYFVAAVGIEYEIFNGLITKTAVNKAKIGSAQTNHYYQMMEDGVKLQVEKAYLNLQTNSKILKEKIKAEQLANSVLARSQELYKNQLIKMNDLLLEQANLQKARAETILAKYNKTIAAAELKLAVGKDLIKE